MAASDSNSDDANTSGMVLFWWVALGAILSGTSLFSLIVTYRDFGLTGVAALVHEQYTAIRDIIFDNLELWLPLPHLLPYQRAALIGLAVLVGVLTRTYVLLSRRVATPALALTLMPTLFCVVLLIGVVGNSIKDNGLGNAIGFTVVVAILPLIVAFFSAPALRLALRLLLLNTAACVLVAVALLALGGALSPAHRDAEPALVHPHLQQHPNPLAIQAASFGERVGALHPDNLRIVAV